MSSLHSGGEQLATHPRIDQIEGLLCELVSGLSSAPTAPGRHRGRPPILPAMLLWTGLLVNVLRQATSQRALWRLLSSQGLWHFPAIPVTDDAIYRRLANDGPGEMEALFRAVTRELAVRMTPLAEMTLAPFAPEVVALDETTLDPVTRRLPVLRKASVGSDVLLPGKLAGAYDVRRQLWMDVQYIADPHQNEKLQARDLLAGIPKGSLILADLGYFSFEWFDDLTDSGYHWISRLRAKTSFEVLHTWYDDGETRDQMIWLGAYRANRAKYAVRLVEFRLGAFRFRYITNVLDPQLLPIRDIARLYQRRWDFEMAVNLVKTHLGLHLLWSSKSAVILTQVWAVLMIAQVLQSLRRIIAETAKVDLFEVSMPLLIEYLPRYAARFPDPIAAYIADAVRLRFIRPSRRTQIRAPDIPADQLIPLPPDCLRIRTPRYADRQVPKMQEKAI